MPSPVSGNRDLVFGLLALRLELLSGEALLQAVEAPMAELEPLGALLQRRGLLRPEQVRHLEGLVQERARSKPASGSMPGTEEEGLTTGPVAPVREPEEALAPGGYRYHKLREHARGGLGEVFVARDEELRREVALKEIQSHHADHPASRARFVREALLTGSLEHPGVVPVYGLGAYPDGRPFYAMRFIQGETLQDALKRFHAGEPIGELALRSLLSRFVAVCNAVAYAHSRGVIHRDIKPANVMLGAFGETLVVDWGLAKAVGQQEEGASSEAGNALLSSGLTPTQAGSAVGTPAFMPPEQARGDQACVGPASDVFALGATLYCLLTGQPPYRGPDALSLAATAPARRAREVNPRAPAALEAVAVRAMAARPEDRYASAAELAADVERWLADEPVTAWREPVAQRLRRWSRRHRVLVSSVGVLLLAALVGLSVGLYAVGQERDRTREALGDARTNLDRALGAEQQAKDNLTRATKNLTRAEGAERVAKANLKQADENMALAKKVVDDTFGVAKGHPALQRPEVREAKKMLLEKAREFYRDFRRQHPENPGYEWEAANQQVRIGYIEAEIGSKDEALKAYRDAARLQGAVCGLVRLDPMYQEHGRTLHNLGALLLRMGRVPEARAALKHALDIRLRLVANEPGNAEYLGELAGTRVNLAGSLIEAGDLKQGLFEMLGAKEALHRAVAAQPAEADHQLSLAQCCGNLAAALKRLGRPGEARRALDGARELTYAVRASRPHDPGPKRYLAHLSYQVGQLRREGKDLPGAITAYLVAEEMGAQLVAAYPNVIEYQEGQATTCTNLGALLGQLGRFPEALRVTRRARDANAALALANPSVPAHRQGMVIATFNEGLTLLRLGQTAPALAALADAAKLATELAARKDANAETDRLHRAAHFHRARVFAGSGRPREAVPEWTKALDLAPDAAFRDECRLRRADALVRTNDHARAAQDAEPLIESKTLDPSDHYDLACVFALCSAAVAKDAALPLPRRDHRAEALARRAVEQLHVAARRSFFRQPAARAILDKDTDLTSLRRRDDFLAFVRSLGPPPTKDGK